jgi:hypothetical protein
MRRSLAGTVLVTLALLALPSRTGAAPFDHRVVYVHDVRATTWDYATNYYRDPTYVHQDVVDGMFLKGMQLLTGGTTYAEAWAALLPNYQAGQTIAIKVNFNNSGGGNSVDSTPQPIHSLVASLLAFGFQESQIRIYDASRVIPTYFKTYVGYPGVVYYDHYAYGGNLLATFNSTDPTATVAFTSSYTGPHKIADVLVNSTYLVNAAIFQRHGGAQISLALKNHFGTIDGLYTGSHGIHNYMYPGSYNYTGSVHNPIVDINMNANIRNKTVLVLGDGLYGDWPENNGTPHRWPSFGNKSPNSLFFGVDPVATDSVMYDRLTVEGSFDARAADVLVDANGRGLGYYEKCGFTQTCARINYVSYDFDGTPTPTPTPGPTATPTSTPTVGPTPVATATPSGTATPRPTATPTPRPAATVTPRPTATTAPTTTPEPIATQVQNVTEEQPPAFSSGWGCSAGDPGVFLWMVLLPLFGRRRRSAKISGPPDPNGSPN